MIKLITVLVLLVAVAYVTIWPTAHFILGMGASCAAKTTCSATFVSNRNFTVDELGLVRFSLNRRCRTLRTDCLVRSVVSGLSHI